MSERFDNDGELPIDTRVRVLEVGNDMLIQQTADIAASLQTMQSLLSDIARDVRGLRDAAPHSLAHLEQAADVILASEPRMTKFWEFGHKQLLRRTWDGLAMAIGQRILTMVVTAAFVVLMAWSLFKAGGKS